MAKFNKQLQGASKVPGFRVNEDRTSLQYVSEELPASKHFFYANYFKALKQGSQFYFVFGEVSPFRSNSVMDRAVQVAMPIQSAVSFFL